MLADVDVVADTLVKEIDKGTDIVYVPWKWEIIMGIIKLIPEKMFKKMNL
jgi:hypothetical protein